MRQNTPMKLRIVFAVVALAGVVAGCSVDPIGVAERERDKSYATVVSLSPSTTEYLVTVGGSTYLGGRTASCDRPEAILAAPVVMTNTEIDAERIKEIEPDLIVYDKSLFGPDAVAKIDSLGVETLVYDANDADTYADYGYRLGAKLSIESYVSRHVDDVYRELAIANANETANPRVTVLIGNPSDGEYLVMGLEGIHAFIISSCGGKPVGADGRLFQTAKIESLIDWNPQVIYSDANAQAIYADPRLQQVDAVKNQRVYDFDSKTLVRVGGYLNAMIKQFAQDLNKMPINPRTGSAK